MEFLKKLISDDNHLNEKAFVGVISFFAMVFTLLTDVITGILGIKLVIHEFIFDGFMFLTIACFGISQVGSMNFKKNKKEKE